MDNVGVLVKDKVRKMSEAAMDAMVQSFITNQDHHVKNLQDVQKWAIVKAIRSFISQKFLHKTPCVVSPQRCDRYRLFTKTSSNKSSATSLGILKVKILKAQNILFGNSISTAPANALQFEWKVVVRYGSQSAETAVVQLEPSPMCVSTDRSSSHFSLWPRPYQSASSEAQHNVLRWDEELMLPKIDDLWGDICIDVFWRRRAPPPYNKNKSSTAKFTLGRATKKKQTAHTRSTFDTTRKHFQEFKYAPDVCASAFQISFSEMDGTPPSSSEPNTFSSCMDLTLSPLSSNKNQQATTQERQAPPDNFNWQLYGRAILPFSSILYSNCAKSPNKTPWLEDKVTRIIIGDTFAKSPPQPNDPDKTLWIHLYPHISEEIKFYRPIGGYPGFGMSSPVNTLGYLSLQITWIPARYPCTSAILSMMYPPHMTWINAQFFEPQPIVSERVKTTILQPALESSLLDSTLRLKKDDLSLESIDLKDQMSGSIQKKEITESPSLLGKRFINSPYGQYRISVEDPTSYCPVYSVFSEDAAETDMITILEGTFTIFDHVQRLSGVGSSIIEKLQFAFNWEDPLLTITSFFVLCCNFFLLYAYCFFWSFFPSWVIRLHNLIPVGLLLVLTDPWFLTKFWLKTLHIDLPLIYRGYMSRSLFRRKVKYNSQSVPPNDILRESTEFSTPEQTSESLTFGPTSEEDKSSSGKHGISDGKSDDDKMILLSRAGSKGSRDSPTQKVSSSPLTDQIKGFFDSWKPAESRISAALSKQVSLKSAKAQATRVAKKSNRDIRFSHNSVLQPSIRASSTTKKSGSSSTDSPLIVVGVFGQMDVQPQDIEHLAPHTRSFLMTWLCSRVNRVYKRLKQKITRLLLCPVYLITFWMGFMVNWWAHLPDRREIEHRQIAASQVIRDIYNELSANSEELMNRGQSDSLQTVHHVSPTLSGPFRRLTKKLNASASNK